ncbi:MAG: endonuclease domain-containing protein [Sediminibacterium sp.]|nr:DUF559 domain-containing protein [uncultured Sediminibacterium sp.]
MQAPVSPLSSKYFARYLRKNQTPEESIIWQLLRNRKLDGFKFLRQHPIKVWETSGRFYFFYADFYCAEKKLVLEIDGLIHEKQKEYDASRDYIMNELGLKVLRILNDEVNHDINGTLQKIRHALK